MSVIAIFSGNFCKKESIIKKLGEQTGFSLITEQDVAAKASKLSGIQENKIMEAFSARTSIFNKFTHEKEKSIAYLRLAMAELLTDDKHIITGHPVHLIPKEVIHVLRICLISDIQSRISVAAGEDNLSEKEATKRIKKHDKDRSAWIQTVLSEEDPWNNTLYDIVIPMDKTSIEDAVSLIIEKSESGVVKYTEASREAVKDFHLASLVETALATEGHNISVSAENGLVKLTINHNVLMLHKLEEDIKAIANKVPGVRDVEIEIGKGFHQTDIYRKYDFEIPSKLLLVDDEREFVQTLSERLLLRDMGSAIAYDGESALNIVNDDEPEVMILDLKMPGIDGIEVLGKVKKTNPNIEVIILTGHGSEADREICMNLGAFAYLHKPVDIDLLSETLKKANEKIKKG